MNPGQPLNLHDLLPHGMTPDTFFTYLVALAAFAVVWMIGSAFIQPDRLTPRLKAIQQRREELKETYRGSKKRKRPEKNIDWMRQIVNRLKLLQETQTDTIQQRLTQAGYRQKDALVVYLFGKIALPFVGLATGFMLADINWDAPFETDSLWGWAMIIGAAYAGAKTPDLLLSNQRSKRYALLQKALPDTLDLMMICAEAGLSLAASLDRVARELGDTYPEMAEELSLTSVEMGFLPDRSTALQHLAERIDTREVRGIVNVLSQTEKYGTPIAQALRVLSSEFRNDRMLRAEEKAARLPALMTVPMIVFILPTLFILVLTPAVISIMDSTM